MLPSLEGFVAGARRLNLLAALLFSSVTSSAPSFLAGGQSADVAVRALTAPAAEVRST